MKILDSLTETVRQDWHIRNLNALQSALQEVELAVNERVNPRTDPLMDTPNRAMYRGQTRWILLPPILERYLSVNRITGLTSRWTPLGSNGVHQYELIGDRTSLVACHVTQSSDSPRECEYRKNRRELNTSAQTLMAFEQEIQAEAQRMHYVTLVFGTEPKTNEPFAYLRMYYDEAGKTCYFKLSSNIMRMPRLLDHLEEEVIEAPQVDLGLKLDTTRYRA